METVMSKLIVIAWQCTRRHRPHQSIVLAVVGKPDLEANLLAVVALAVPEDSPEDIQQLPRPPALTRC